MRRFVSDLKISARNVKTSSDDSIMIVRLFVGAATGLGFEL